MALAVEAAAREAQELVLAEFRELEDDGEMEPDDAGGSIWDEELPLLCGTIRGLDGDEERLIRRTVSVARVVRRWFVFESGRTEAYEDHEMQRSL